MRCKLVNAMGSDEFRGNNNNLENFEIATVNETSLVRAPNYIGAEHSKLGMIDWHEKLDMSLLL